MTFLSTLFNDSQFDDFLNTLFNDSQFDDIFLQGFRNPFLIDLGVCLKHYI
jgi:hypothetical protein